jgi:NRPS condensation-like uncharacterized protein
MAIYQAETLDQYMKFQEITNDHQMRCIIKFESEIDIECLKQALIQTFKLIPILASRYVENKKKAYWKNDSEKYNVEDFFYFHEGTNTEKILTEFLSKKINENAGPQIIFALFRERKIDTVCFVVNHMVFDSSGFKHFLYLLSKLYSNILEGNNYTHKISISVNRNFSEIFKHIGIFDRIRLIFRKNRVLYRDISVLNSETRGVAPKIFLFKIDRNRFKIIKRYCTRMQVTLNDVVIAIYCKVLFVMCNIKKGESLVLTSMIDLRRYDTESVLSMFSNLASMAKIIVQNDNNDFDDFVLSVSNTMNEKKKDFLGLANLEGLSLISKIVPYSKLAGLLKKKISELKITNSNLGIIEKDKLVFSGTPIIDAYITTAFKYKPYFQLTFSSYNNSITFSVSGYLNKTDENIVIDFLKLFDKTLLMVTRDA